MKKQLILGTLAGGLLLLVAAPASAQFYYYGGRGPSYGVSTPYFSAYYGRAPYYGRAWYGDPYSYRYSYSYPLRTYTYRYPPGYYGPEYSWYAYPSYGGGVAVAPMIAQAPRTEQRRAFFGPGFNGDQALLRVALPSPDAKLWIQGVATQQPGAERLFVSPALEPGRKYTYQIKAAWIDNGREVSRDQQIEVWAGQEFPVNFMDAQDGAARAAPPKDLPREGEALSQPTELRFRVQDRDRQPAILPRANVHTGVVVSAGDEKLIMADAQGANRHTHLIAKDVQIFVQDKPAQLSDLKPGMQIEVTTKQGDRGVVLEIRAKPAAPAEPGRGLPP